jgi:4-amino-4-deoxy-L-arabinose transferase-like glycosyltransferase
MEDNTIEKFCLISLPLQLCLSAGNTLTHLSIAAYQNKESFITVMVTIYKKMMMEATREMGEGGNWITPPVSSAETGTILWWHYLLVISVTAVLMLSSLSVTPLDNHEALVAVTARTMTEPSHWINPDAYEKPIPPNTPLNHWLVPVFNGRPRLVKTPLAYWLVAGLVKLGLPMDEFTSRLPSAIAAVLTAVVVLALGSRMLPPLAALLGALIFSSSLGLHAWGRDARPEMFLCLSMTVTMACFYLGITASKPGKRHAWMIAAWLAAGLGNLSKEFVPLFLAPSVVLYLAWRSAEEDNNVHIDGTRFLLKTVLLSLAGLSIAVVVQAFPLLHWWKPLGMPIEIGKNLGIVVLAGMPLIWFVLRCRTHRQLIPLLPTAVPGAILMFSLFLPWLWYMGHLFSGMGHVLSEQVLDRGLGELGLKHGLMDQLSGVAAWYYLLSLIKFSAPWSIAMPFALALPFMNRFRDERPGLIFLFCWVFGLALLLSAADGKRQHYILPALPALCMMMGVFMEEVLFRQRWISAKAVKFFLSGGACVLLLLTAVSVVSPNIGTVSDAQWRHINFLSMSALFFFLGISVVALLKRHSFAALSLIIAAVMTGWIIFASQENLWVGNNDLSVFSKKASLTIPPDASVASLTAIERQMVFYLGRDILPAYIIRERMENNYGEEQGEMKWREWIISEKGPTWIFVRYDQREEIKGLGFIPVMDSSGPEEKRQKSMWFLFRKL